MCGLRRLHDGGGGILWQTELYAGGVVETGRALRACLRNWQPTWRAVLVGRGGEGVKVGLVSHLPRHGISQRLQRHGRPHILNSRR